MSMLVDLDADLSDLSERWLLGIEQDTTRPIDRPKDHLVFVAPEDTWPSTFDSIQCAGLTTGCGGGPPPHPELV
jgi:hypothetical protein